MKEILYEKDLNEAFKESQERPVLIYKHSSICSTSNWTAQEVEKFIKENPSAPVWRVLVIEQRLLSQAIAQKTNIIHQSPQALVLINGEVTWSASHGDIKVENLVRALEVAA